MSEDEFISSSERFIHSEGVFAGRNHSLEDKSSNPKSVYCPTVTPSHPELVSTLWNLNLATSL